MKADSTIIIPVSGNTSQIENVISIHDSILRFNDQLSILIIFDLKDSEKSNTNYEYLASHKMKNARLIAKKFDNVGDARNAGLDEISTQWFSYCDSDDRILADNYVRVLNDANEEGVDMAIGGFLFTDLGKTSLVIPECDGFLDWKSAGRNPGLWRYLYRTNSLSQVKFPSLNMAEDQIYLSRIYSQNPSLWVSALPVYEYIKQVHGSLTSTAVEVRKITLALDTSKGIEYSKIGNYRSIQRAFITTQILTSIKNVPILARFKFVFRLITHTMNGNCFDIRSSMKFLNYCYRSKK